jgi:hypothetical protein
VQLWGIKIERMRYGYRIRVFPAEIKAAYFDAQGLTELWLRNIAVQYRAIGHLTGRFYRDLKLRSAAQIGPYSHEARKNLLHFRSVLIESRLYFFVGPRLFPGSTGKHGSRKTNIENNPGCSKQIFHDRTL